MIQVRAKEYVQLHVVNSILIFSKETTQQFGDVEAFLLKIFFYQFLQKLEIQKLSIQHFQHTNFIFCIK